MADEKSYALLIASVVAITAIVGLVLFSSGTRQPVGLASSANANSDTTFYKKCPAYQTSQCNAAGSGIQMCFEDTVPAPPGFGMEVKGLSWHDYPCQFGCHMKNGNAECRERTDVSLWESGDRGKDTPVLA